MSQVVKLFPEQVLSGEHQRLIDELDSALTKAINKCIDAQVPKCMILGMLHAHAWQFSNLAVPMENGHV